MMNLQENNYENIRKGLFFLGKTIQEVSDSLTLCPHMVTEIDEVNRMGRLFKFPESIVYEPHKSLIVNGMEVYPWLFVFTRFYKKLSFTAG
jgi:hypothetical protein